MLFKYKKNNTLLFTLACCCFVFALTGVAQNPHKNPKHDLESKKKKINAEISEINSLLSETKTHKKNSIGALVNINMKLQKRQELINTINTQIGELDGVINATESDIQRLKNNLVKLKKEYARMIFFAQRNQDSYSNLMFIFASTNFNQAYSRLKYMQQYAEFRKKQAVEIINTQTLLLAKLSELKEQKNEKNALLGNQVQEKNLLSGEKIEQEQVLTELQKKEKQLKNDLEKKKQAAVQLQLAIKKLISDEIKRKAAEAAKAAEQRAIAAKKVKEEKLKNKKENEKTTTVPDIANNSNTSTHVPDKKENPFVPELSEAAEALSADFANNRGKLPWPVAKGIICETYGEHEHPAIKGFMMFNNGLEICATKGTQARSVFDGEVTSIAISPTGGKLVIIRHGEYLSVYCNLGDVFVKTGQKVSVKQTIGVVMHDDDEGKTSMNLQIWKGQKTMDPSAWLFNAH